MKRFVICCSLVLWSAVLVGGCAPKGENQAEMIAAAKTLDEQFVKAYNQRDVDGVMATYWNNPELVSYPPDMMETHGWQATKDAMAKSIAETPSFTLELTEIHYQVAGDIVLGWGKWRFTIPDPKGAPIVMDGRYSDVKAKRDGKWVYILDHASVPLPPAPAPATKP